MWRRFRPKELATPGVFRRDPQLLWWWYDWRRGLNSELVRQIVLGKMPRRAPKLLPDQIQAITDWVNAGALDN